ncbi:hypothetical protein [Hymenobacter yonginensis]|uniref:Uncharacterized protein n=1 Tax=Hymenobacter yonginensis TaxID=748197 RepID=A0ABY7PST0_9BACT|nr:hypothetical protein [Hymenobacter yonginensis]WBO85978.1 hypothetical protein O9Z63_06925 [Hymenobacter yonginensis]
MRRHYLCLLLLTAPLAALAQTPSETPAAAAATTQYGFAYTVSQLGGGAKLIIVDGITPNPKLRRYQEGGRDKEFLNEAAALNFLATQGWEVSPLANEPNRYFLKRPRQ